MTADTLTAELVAWCEAAGVAPDDGSPAAGAALLARLRLMYPELWSEPDPWNALARHLAGRPAAMGERTLVVPLEATELGKGRPVLRVTLPAAVRGAVKAFDSRGRVAPAKRHRKPRRAA